MVIFLSKLSNGTMIKTRELYYYPPIYSPYANVSGCPRNILNRFPQANTQSGTGWLSALTTLATFRRACFLAFLGPSGYEQFCGAQAGGSVERSLPFV